MYTNGLNIGLLLQACVKKTVDSHNIDWLSGKEKVPGAAVSKEGHAYSLLGNEGPTTIDFLEKGATVNSASYCQVIRKTLPYLLNDPCVCVSADCMENQIGIFYNKDSFSSHITRRREFCKFKRAECSPMVLETGAQSQVESYQRLKKWYLMLLCLKLSVIRYGSRVNWSNPRKGVVPSPTVQCSSYWKGSLWVTLD